MIWAKKMGPSDHCTSPLKTYTYNAMYSLTWSTFPAIPLLRLARFAMRSPIRSPDPELDTALLSASKRCLSSSFLA